MAWRWKRYFILGCEASEALGFRGIIGIISYLVTATATAADPGTTIGFFAGKPDVFFLRGSQRITVRLHGVIREMLALPGFDVGAAGDHY